MEAWDKPTPLREASDDSDSSYYGDRKLGEGKRYSGPGVLIEDTPREAIGNVRGNERSRMSSTRRDFDKDNDNDDSFDRDFYLSEEGQMADTDSRSDPFIGNSQKFKEREEQVK